MYKNLIVVGCAVLIVFAFSNFSKKNGVEGQSNSDSLIFKGEKHFANLHQLTFGGDNAEAYWSWNGKMITFQKTNPKENINCDRIYFGNYNENKFDFTQISNGESRTTCSFFMPGDTEILFAGMHESVTDCPPVPDRKILKKYVWPLYPEYDIYVNNLHGKTVRKLTDTKGYDAEATISPDGKTIVFTSTRNGDIDLYTMDIYGKNVHQITNTLGYDGGANFSADGKKIVWRASRPNTDETTKEYKDLLSQNMVAPTNMEVFVANIDGSDVKQVTHLGKANWAPAFHPSGKKIIFASNHEYERGFPFNLYLINIDGTGLEKISHDGGFDAFPMFSWNGKKLIFSSNRNNGGTHDTNVFVADWVE
jgi:Tol biopolymer transport system component